MSSTLQTDVPLVNVPFVDPKTGAVTEAWFIFLIQLWRRTGGTSGDLPTGITIDAVLAIEQTFGAILPSDPSGAIFAAEQTNSLGSLQEPLTEMERAPSSRQEALLEMIFAMPSSGIDIVDNTFTAGVDFTAGTTTALTLTRSFGAIPRLWIYFDGIFQGDDQVASLVGQTLTFTAAIPVGVTKVYVKGLVLG